MSIRRAQDERIEGTPDGISAISEIMDVPDAPTIGTATAAGLSASVTFTAATTGGTATTYTVTSTPGSFTGTGASSPITVSGLADGTSYTFKVKGTNATGVVGPESSASNSITAADPLTGAYYSLAAVTLSASASSITFTGIPSGYKHLQVRGLVRSARASAADDMLMTINSDTGSNYAWHSLQGDGSAAATNGLASQANIHVMRNNLPSSTTASNMFGVIVVDILDYANTSKYKTTRTLMGGEFNGGTTGYVGLMSGLWQNTNAITSLTFQEETGANLVQYSQLALYGVK